MLVAAGQAAKGHVGAGGANVEAFHDVLRGLAHGLAVEQAEALEAAQPFDEEVLGHAHVDDAANGVSVFRHDADAGGGDVARGFAGERLALHEEAAFAGGLHAGQHGRQFALAIAFDTGHGHDLAGFDDEGEVVQAGHAIGIAHGEAIDHQGGLGFGGAFCLGLMGTFQSGRAQRAHVALDHGAHQCIQVLRGVLGSGGDAATAQYRGALGDLLDLGQLVRHQHHAAALVGHALAHVQQ